jgi:bacterioferritin-associated ferredoxin
VCYAVTEEDIEDLLDAGFDTFDGIIDLSGGTKGCGKCECAIRSILENYRQSQSSSSTDGISAVTKPDVSSSS